ncbi:MAG TPA: hypothetical protein VKR42_09515 [Ktedonobacteraceae bacterium]|nr:hypothetical protein [Ktedonobacteraceae bacterium]
MTNESEVARLRRQIDMEFEALQRIKSGLSIGTARHDFISARMRSVDGCQDKLEQLVGDAQASQIVYGLYTEHFEK